MKLIHFIAKNIIFTLGLFYVSDHIGVWGAISVLLTIIIIDMFAYIIENNNQNDI